MSWNDQRIAAVHASGQMLALNVASVALTIEALELLLVEKGVLAENELMVRLEALAKQKTEQVSAAQAVAKPEPRRIITV